MKGILTEDHIKFILLEVEKPIYKTQGVISFSFLSKDALSIHQITPKGLIFILGTDDTGFTHLHKRHANRSLENYWDEFYDNKGNKKTQLDSLGRKKYRLDNPGKFPPFSIPAFDYRSIADQVFEKINLHNNKNKRQDLFDLYEGEVIILNREKQSYRLLLYKNTKIVHTLFPLDRKYNRQKKIVIDLVRLTPSMVHNLENDDYHIEVPYEDEYGIVRYIVIIRNDPYSSLRERWYIQANSPFGEPLLTHDFGSRIKHLEINSLAILGVVEEMDLTPIEKRMRQIERSLKPLKHRS